MLSRVTAKNVGDVFWDTVYIVYFYCFIFLLTFFLVLLFPSLFYVGFMMNDNSDYLELKLH